VGSFYYSLYLHMAFSTTLFAFNQRTLIMLKRHIILRTSRIDKSYKRFAKEKDNPPWRRKTSLAVHVAHAGNFLRGWSAAADGVEAASSSVGMSSHATALFTRAMGRNRPRASSSGAGGAACRFHVLLSRRCLGVSLV
jgi:hypothetical protein